MSRPPSPTDVSVANRQRRHPVDAARCRAVAAFFVRCAARTCPSAPWASVAVLLVGDRGSAEAHGRVFADPSPTDVITLSYAAVPGVTDGMSGELIVNVDRAVAEGVRRAAMRRPRAWGPDQELALYIAHGVDHLTGADDHEDADFRRMRARDLRWVAAAGRAGLVAGLLRDRR